MAQMFIYIPTYRRDIQFTFNSLPLWWKQRVVFVVDGFDARGPIGDLAVKYGCSIWSHPPEIKTIAAKRAFIIKEAQHDRIMMFDDDLRFAYRPDPTQSSLLPADPAQVGRCLIQVETMLDQYAHVGISARQGNNNLEPGWIKNTRMMYALGYDLPTLRQHCELGRIETREDMDYTLQLLKKGFQNIVTSEYCTDQKYNAPGGCSKQRTVESSNADAEKLAALHPGLVRIAEKAYKGSIPRKEVVVSWKKALQQGIHEQLRA